MGTRHFIGAVVDGQYKIAQYGQWDGYPSGQGVDILNFLQSYDREKFLAALRQCHWITEDEIRKRYETLGIDPDAKFITSDESNAILKNYPEMHRDTGSKILRLTEESDAGLSLENAISFANDSVFCEWAYVIDFDKESFEVYKGFNKTPLTKDDRFYLKDIPDKHGYYPVRLLHQFSLQNLPTEEDFLKICEATDNVA